MLFGGPLTLTGATGTDRREVLGCVDRDPAVCFVSTEWFAAQWTRLPEVAVTLGVAPLVSTLFLVLRYTVAAGDPHARESNARAGEHPAFPAPRPGVHRDGADTTSE